MIDELMRKLAAEKGLRLEDGVFSRLSTFYSRLTEANAKMNLTRIEGEENTAHMHFMDSLSPLFFGQLNGSEKCLDVGAGAGFPSIPLAIARADLDITLLDAVGKKVKFLESLADIAPNTAPVHARAEDLAHKPQFREQFDCVFARAVAPLNVLCEITLPFVKIGGKFIAWKGPSAGEEIADSRGAIRALGADMNIIEHEYDLMDGLYNRRLIIVQKVRHTSTNFPRNPKVIRNKPINS